tara:strand:- start:3933 stop:4964 length:1032 start_codon:yes stop_codon:yes gene_type:complete
MSFAPLSGVPRLLLMPLVTLVFIGFLKSERDFDKVYNLVLICLFIGALSIIFQFFFGVITWFADSATRGVLTRYSSILGSLTVFGSITGYLLIYIFGPLNSLKNVYFRSLFFTLLIFAIALSLQKIALLILFISGVFLFIYNIKFNGLKVKTGNLIALLAIFLSLPVLFLSSPLIQTYTSSLLTIVFNVDVGSFSSSLVSVNDVGTSSLTLEAITQRLYGFTLLAYENYGNYIFILGVGLRGGAGVMGMEGISAHNGVLDLLLIGGPLYILSAIYLYCDVQNTLFKDIKNKLSATFFILNLVFIVVAIFTAGAFFQPSISAIFWLSVAYAFMKKSKNTVNSEL